MTGLSVYLRNDRHDGKMIMMMIMMIMMMMIMMMIMIMMMMMMICIIYIAQSCDRSATTRPEHFTEFSV